MSFKILNLLLTLSLDFMKQTSLELDPFEFIQLNQDVVVMTMIEAEEEEAEVEEVEAEEAEMVVVGVT